MKFEIELWDKVNNKEVLGNLDGQAIYRDLKTLRGVLNRLKNAKPLKQYRNGNYEYRIIRGNNIIYTVNVCDIIQ